MRALLLALALLGQDAKVKAVKDIPYHEGGAADPKKHKLDLYLPVTDKPFPVAMWIHGGGWMMGDRSMFGALGERMAERGIGCAVISYRLSPGVKHPEHVRDCARAFAWLHANAKAHGGDPDRLFVFGQSAGGHLSALLTLDPKYLAEQRVPEGALKGAVPMSGVYSIPALPGETKAPLLSLFPKSFGSDAEACRAASPISYLKGSSIPMLVLTETQDVAIRPQMEALKAAAGKEGLKHVLFEDAKERNHFSIVIRMMRAGEDPVRDRVVDFIRSRCGELDAKR